MFGIYGTKPAKPPMKSGLDHAFLQTFMQNLKAKRRASTAAFQPPPQGAMGPGLEGGRLHRRMSGPIAGQMHKMNMNTQAVE